MIDFELLTYFPIQSRDTFYQSLVAFLIYYSHRVLQKVKSFSYRPKLSIFHGLREPVYEYNSLFSFQCVYNIYSVIFTKLHFTKVIV